MKSTKFLIIGAGISGLTFANYVSSDYLVIEKENNVGGYCKTFKRNGYTWDYSGHFFHFAKNEIKDEFLNKIPKDEIIYNEKNTKILYKGNRIDYPFQSNIHQLEKEEFIECLYDLFNKEEKENYDNFLDMLYGKFGKSIVDKFLKPYNEKLYAVDLKKLDVDSMGRFFPYADKQQIINNMKKKSFGSYNSSFLYFKNGAMTFVDLLYKNLEKDKIYLNTTIEKIDINNKIVTLSNGEIIKYEFLINTIPLNVFLNLVGNYSELINEMSYNKVLVLNLGFDNCAPSCTNEHWMYIPDKEVNYYRIGFYNNILHEKKLSMYVEISFDKNEIIDENVINRQLELTLKNLKKYGIINDNIKLVDYMPLVMDPAYIHINKDTSKKIEDLKKCLELNQIYTIGRYGLWCYNSIEDCMIIAKELAAKLKGK